MQTECLHLCPLQDAHSLGWPQSCFISLNAPKTCETTSEANCKKVFQDLLRKKELKRETQEPVTSKANGKKNPTVIADCKILPCKSSSNFCHC